MAKIAVFSKDGKTASFLECNLVCIYEYNQSSWKLSKSISIPPLPVESIGTMRNGMKEIISFIGGADAVCCEEITGIPFTEFDRAGFCIFAVSQVDEQMLDGIMADIEASDEKKRIRNEVIKNARPVETETPGVYSLNLITLQKECPEVSSKKALREFLDQVPFLELHVDCAHVPPWLERENGLELRMQAGPEAVHLVLTKKQC